MRIDEERFRKFCLENKVDKQNEGTLRKLCYEIASGSILITTLQEELSKFDKSKDKVKYLREKGYTQEKTAEMIGISPRQVQKIEKKLRDS